MKFYLLQPLQTAELNTLGGNVEVAFVGSGFTEVVSADITTTGDVILIEDSVQIADGKNIRFDTTTMGSRSTPPSSITWWHRRCSRYRSKRYI